jgi:post-segregation antitoxin (ccd killing protein)
VLESHNRFVHFPGMTLSDYLRQTGATLQQLGAKIGVSHSTVQRWATGRATPRDQVTMEALVRATGGAVTPADFFPVAARLGAADFAESQAPFATEARALGLDPEAIAAKAIRDAIRAEKERRWLDENRDAIAAHNEWVEKHGVPLAKYRMF